MIRHNLLTYPIPYITRNNYKYNPTINYSFEIKISRPPFHSIPDKRPSLPSPPPFHPRILSLSTEKNKGEMEKGAVCPRRFPPAAATLKKVAWSARARHGVKANHQPCNAGKNIYPRPARHFHFFLRAPFVIGIIFPALA